jgi:RNA polymerase subunit RPABC4/transcription elongation factor Spt4
MTVSARRHRWFDELILPRPARASARGRSNDPMDPIFKAIGDAIDGVVSNPIVGIAVQIAAAYVVVVWLAAALWVFVDVRRRTVNLILPYAAAAAIVLASPLLFPFAVFVHRVIRPASTVADRRMSELRDAALGAELDLPRCPGCRIVVDEDWLICPSCRQALGHRCEHCGRTGALDWDVCAWCGSPLSGEEPRSIARR